MKRLIISLGLAWALIYTANHTVFVRAASDTDAKVATSIEQVSTDRRIDSWGPYLPNVRPPLPDENPTVSPSQTRQPRQVAARQIETDSASSADTSPAPRKESSDVGAKARGELSKKASIDGMESRSMLKKLSGCIPQGEEVSPARDRRTCVGSSIGTPKAGRCAPAPRRRPLYFRSTRVLGEM